MGALAHYVTVGPRGDFAPMNANLGLLPTIPKQRGVSKMERKSLQCTRAKDTFEAYQKTMEQQFSDSEGYLY